MPQRFIIKRLANDIEFNYLKVGAQVVIPWHDLGVVAHNKAGAIRIVWAGSAGCKPGNNGVADRLERFGNHS